MSNIESYYKYKKKYELLGKSMPFTYCLIEDEDRVCIMEYIPNDEKKRCIEIPSFVTDIRGSQVNGILMDRGVFSDAKQSLKVINKSKILDYSHMFYGFSGKELDLSEFEIKTATDLKYMFYNCFSVKKLDLSGFNTSKVTNMAGMFEHCTALEELDISSFDTSNVSNLEMMFNHCTALRALDVSKFNTSNVRSVYAMFGYCRSLESINISNFSTDKLSGMNSMFLGCTNIKEINLGSMDTSKVESMEYMFSDCVKLEKIDMSNQKLTNLIEAYGMFMGCENLKEVILTESSYEMNISKMFSKCKKLERVVGNKRAILAYETREFEDELFDDWM